MTRSKRKWPVILGIAFIALVIAVIAWTSGGNTQEHCRVCVTFNGRTNCGSSAATTREQAERTATDLACNSLIGNMTELLQCQNSPTRQVTFRQ
ncbi:MAG: hypothetical protein M3N93_13660 [Acidobacteriota bacterium]|nr:hypothetical protein [Acidobacteriota bacterium]